VKSQRSYIKYFFFFLFFLASMPAFSQIGLTGSSCVVPDGTTQYTYTLYGSWATSNTIEWNISGGYTVGTSQTYISGTIEDIGIQIVVVFNSTVASIQVQLVGQDDAYTLNINGQPALTPDLIAQNQTVNFSTTPSPLTATTNLGGSCGFTNNYDWQSSPSYYGPFVSTGITSAEYDFSGALGQTTYFRRVVSNYNGSVTSNVVKITLVSAYWENMNYIREHEILVPGITDFASADQLPTGQKLQSTTYLDGLGRSIQTVKRESGTPTRGSSQWGDIVKPIAFDPIGRQSQVYLPYVTYTTRGSGTTQMGQFQNTAFIDQPQYYQTNYGQSPAYDQYTFDNSPLSRVVNIKQSGNAWAAGTGKTSGYELNDQTADNVQIWTIQYGSTDYPVDAGAYASNTLFKVSTTDENGKEVIEYKNNLGQVILRKIKKVDDPADPYNDWICTYNVYDDFGHLRCIIQPEAVNYLYNHSWSFDGSTGQTVLNEECVQYQYDDKGRTIFKKSAGALPVNMIYDARDRLVFNQDGNQNAKSPGEWGVSLYDALDRVVIEALYETSQTLSQLQSDVVNEPTSTPVIITDNVLDYLIESSRDPSIFLYVARYGIEFDDGFESISGDEFETRIDPNATTGTLDNVMVYGDPIPNSDIINPDVFNALLYNYYDDYTFTGAQSFYTSYQNSTAYSGSTGNINPDAITQSARTWNQMTGTNIRVLNTSTFLMSTFYYDEKGRQIQSSSTNIKTGVDITTRQYNFDGRLLSTYLNHNATGTPYTNYGILTRYDFDKIARLTTVEKMFGSNDFISLVTYDYDDIGRLKTRHLAPGYTGSGKSEMEALSYSYNLHSQLTGINKDYALQTPGLYDKWGNFFGMYLGYDNQDNVFNQARLDGLITGQLWSTQGDDAQKKYDYSYDDPGRLNNAAYNQRLTTADGWSTSLADFSVSGHNGQIEYDLDGNLTYLMHKGVVPGQNSTATVDDLSYTYASNSNKLTGVTDQGNLGDLNGQLGDFFDASGGTATTSTGYSYDNNGNVLTDLYKNISPSTSIPGGNGISYNFLNKPDQISIAGKGIIQFVYDASGNKLQKLFTPVSGNNAPATATTYIGDFIYEAESSPGSTTLAPDSLRYILFEEGRLRVMRPVDSTNGVDYITINGNLTMLGDGMGALDFFVKDHLGNTRMVLTEETSSGTQECTMETARSAIEEAIFGQVDGNGNPTSSNEVETTRFAVSDIPGQSSDNGWNSSQIGSYVSRVGNLAAGNMGPNSLLKVMAGDQISARSIFYYQQGSGSGSNSNLLSAMLISLGSALMSGSGSPAFVQESASNITTNLSGSADLINLTNASSTTGSGVPPQAYLTILFFDDQLNLIPDATQQRQVNNTDDGSNPLVIQSVLAPKNGYAYVYVSNQSDEMVYFDNLTINQTHGNIIEENHYYAYGLPIAAISDRKWGDLVYEGKLINKYRYQASYSEEEENTGWDEFSLRMYDPQIGRWMQEDPDDQISSPYLGMGNNPTSNTDPTGGFYLPADLIGGAFGAIVGGVITYTIAKKDGANTLQSIGWGLLGAAGGAAIGYEIAENLSFSSYTIDWSKLKKWAFKGIGRQVASSVLINDLLGGKSKDFGFSQLWKDVVGGATFGAIQGIIGSSLQVGDVYVNSEGIKESHIGDGLYNAFTSVGKSVISDWANGASLFSDVNVAIGPVTFSFGKSQTLLQWQQNIFALIDLGNWAISSIHPFGLHPSKAVAAELTSGGVFWTSGGYLNDFIDLLRIKWGNSSTLFSIKTVFHLLGNVGKGLVNPGDGILTKDASFEYQW
jgi:RHS repeat-associated protein